MEGRAPLDRTDSAPCSDQISNRITLCSTSILFSAHFKSEKENTSLKEKAAISVSINVQISINREIEKKWIN